MSHFAIYVVNPYEFEGAFGCKAAEGELYRVQHGDEPELGPGLEYHEMEQEPDYNTYEWNRKRLRFEHKNPMLRFIERIF